MRVADSLRALLARHADAPALIGSSGESWSYGDIASRVEFWRSQLSVKSRLVIAAPAVQSLTFLGLLFTSALDRHSLVLLPAAATSDPARFLPPSLLIDCIVGDAGLERMEVCGPVSIPGNRVVLLTSGTTGRPKAVEHTWESLAGPALVKPDFERTRWMTTFPLHLYAGCQVLFQTVLNAGCLVRVDTPIEPETVVERAVEAGAEFFSSTPSLWRQLLLRISRKRLACIPMRQITLGGEVVDQPTLDGLRSVFPKTRLVHIYATSELGRCFAVSDGRAGFAAEYLERGTAEGVGLRIVDGELQVRPRHSMVRYATGENDPRGADTWISTGDLVAVSGDRVVFLGRRSEMINVGGQKVSPLHVESVLLQHPAVVAARVYSKASRLAGQLVAAEVMLRDARQWHEVSADVLANCRERLREHEIPRFVTAVQDIPLSQAGKTNRQERETK